MTRRIGNVLARVRGVVVRTLCGAIVPVVGVLGVGGPWCRAQSVHSLPQASLRTLSDVDEDGVIDILQTSNSGNVHIDDTWVHVYTIRNQAPFYKGQWPQRIQGHAFLPPATGELDPSRSGKEVVAVNLAPTVIWDLEVYAFSSDGELLWARTLEGYQDARALVLSDLDADGRDEIVIGGGDGATFVAVLTHEGTMFSGWPRSVEYLGTKRATRVSLAAGDIDNDGHVELVYGAALLPAGVGDFVPSCLFAFEADGTFAEGWHDGVCLPEDEGGMNRIAMADLTGDGYLEIVTSTDRTGHAYLHVYTSTGHELAPRHVLGVGAQSPVIADLDGDGFLEVVVSNRLNRTNVFDRFIELQYSLPVAGEVAIGGVTAGGPSILISSRRDDDHDALFAFRDGCLQPGWPVVFDEPIGDYTLSALQKAPVVGNVDLDPDTEILVGNALVNVPHPYSTSTQEWATFQSDARHSGVYRSPRRTDSVFIQGSVPPYGAIDGRQPPVVSGGKNEGWRQIEVTFSAAVKDVRIEDVLIAEHGSDGVPPEVLSLSQLSERTVLIELAAAVAPGAWTTVAFRNIDGQVRLGSLPSDVNADGLSSVLDVLALIDGINGVGCVADERLDIDRSGIVDAGDVARILELLDGSATDPVWRGYRLPDVE